MRRSPVPFFVLLFFCFVVVPPTNAEHTDIAWLPLWEPGWLYYHWDGDQYIRTELASGPMCVPTLISCAHRIKAFGNFDAHPRLDLVVQSLGYTTFEGVTDVPGDVRIVFQDDEGFASPFLSDAPKIGNARGSGWRIKAVVNIDQVGLPDILWRNQMTGETAYWLVGNNGTLAGCEARKFDCIQGLPLPTVTVAYIDIATVGDFDANGTTDIFWRDPVKGTNAIWLLDPNGYQLGRYLPTIPDGYNHKVVTAADFDGDGRDDLLWYNAFTGDSAIWFLDGATLRAGRYLPRIADPYWQPQAAGDFNGDGKADVWWHHIGNGANAIWFMDGETIAEGRYIDSIDTKWLLIYPRKVMAPLGGMVVE